MIAHPMAMRSPVNMNPPVKVFCLKPVLRQHAKAARKVLQQRAANSKAMALDGCASPPRLRAENSPAPPMRTYVAAGKQPAILPYFLLREPCVLRKRWKHQRRTCDAQVRGAIP